MSQDKEREALLKRANALLDKLLDHDLQYSAQTGAAQIVDDLIAALATQPPAVQGEPVAFEFYNPTTGHAIVDYSRQTHVGPLTKEMGYEARALGYINPPPAAVKPGDPVPLWQALEALDSLEESSRGDAPYNHFAAGLVRSALEQSATPPAPGQAVTLSNEDAAYESEHPAAKRMRLDFEAKYGAKSALMRAANNWFNVRTQYNEAWNRDREQPVTESDVEEAERAMLATQQAVQGEPARRVYLVATGELHEGEETYTRHDDAPPPLCDSECLYTTPPAPGQVERDREDAVLAYLDKLEDDAAVHIWPDDLAKCQTSECVVEVASVRMGSPDGKTLPLFSRDQVRDAVRAARSSEGGSNG